MTTAIPISDLERRVYAAQMQACALVARAIAQDAESLQAQLSQVTDPARVIVALATMIVSFIPGPARAGLADVLLGNAAQMADVIAKG